MTTITLSDSERKEMQELESRVTANSVRIAALETGMALGFKHVGERFDDLRTLVAENGQRSRADHEELREQINQIQAKLSQSEGAAKAQAKQGLAEQEATRARIGWVGIWTSLALSLFASLGWVATNWDTIRKLGHS